MRQFHELFTGRADVYGTYTLPKADGPKGSKRTGRVKTISDTEVTPELYEKHTKGEVGIGIVPIRLDGTVSFFAIDVDKYGEDDLHQSLAAKIAKHDLPLFVFKTKSGGAHLFCFLTEPMPAEDARKHAMRYLTKLGLPKKTEIFPKQDAILKADSGSWINLLYFGATRPCMGLDGKTPLDLEQFLKLAADREVHPSDLSIQPAVQPRRPRSRSRSAS